MASLNKTNFTFTFIIAILCYYYCCCCWCRFCVVVFCGGFYLFIGVFLVLCFFGVVIVDFVVPLLPLILIFLFLFFLFKFFMFSVLCVDLTFISIYKYIVPVTT